MLNSWADVLLGFITWWVGLYWLLRAGKRRWTRNQRNERDIAALIVMWFGAVLTIAGISVVLGSMVMTALLR